MECYWYIKMINNNETNGYLWNLREGDFKGSRSVSVDLIALRILAYIKELVSAYLFEYFIHLENECQAAMICHQIHVW